MCSFVAGTKIAFQHKKAAATAAFLLDQLSPPNSQMIRMIGSGIPINHNKSPRPMVRLLGDRRIGRKTRERVSGSVLPG
jgi:hypothetical protein